MPPLKRHPALQPLSREHHEILLAVWKLRQGLAAGVAPERMTMYVHHFAAHYLQPHVAKEKAVVDLLPSVELAVQQYHIAVKEIEKNIAAVHRQPDTIKIEELANLIYNTVRFEERELFALIQSRLSKEQLQNIGATTAQLQCPLWPDEFWIQK